MDFSSDLGLRSGGTASAYAVRTPRERALEAMVRIAAARGYQATSVADVRAGRSGELQRVLPDLVFAVTMPYLGVEAAETEMRRVRMG